MAKWEKSRKAINHFIACMWFFIADSQRGKVDMTWVEANSFQESVTRDTSVRAALATIEKLACRQRFYYTCRTKGIYT
eukprot:1101399-Amphidinium_carterae.1